MRERKKGGPAIAGPPFSRLEASDVRSLQAFRPSGYFEFNRLAFVQRFVPLCLNGGEVDENVLTGLALDEPKSLAGIEPLHCSLFSHLFTHFFFKLFALLDRLQPQSKGAGEFLKTRELLFDESKGVTGATNAA